MVIHVPFVSAFLRIVLRKSDFYTIETQVLLFVSTYICHSFYELNSRSQHIVKRQFRRTIIPWEGMVVVMEPFYTDHPYAHVVAGVERPVKYCLSILNMNHMPNTLYPHLFSFVVNYTIIGIFN